jgi:glutathione peroxidase
MNKLTKWVGVLLVLATAACSERSSMTSLYDITVQTIQGESITLNEYRGKTLLIVNTASRCGFTGQFEGLQNLYETYQDQGLIVLAFPSNNFMGQEPGSNEAIAAFCETRFQTTFPLFAKINVKGRNQHPLFTWLTSNQSNPSFGGDISWNFNKFLISSEGSVINRFGSRTAPNQKKLITAIEQALPKAVPQQ